MKYLKIIVLFAITCTSCNKEQIEPEVQPGDLLLGKWSMVTYGEVVTFERVVQFDEAYGLEFVDDHAMLEWSHGFCGTPPIVYSEIEGTYVLRDNTIMISTWIEWSYRIKKLSETELVLEPIEDLK